MAELPQTFVPGTSSDRDAGDDGEVAVPAYDQPGPSRDRSSSLTGEPLRIRRGTRRPWNTSSGMDGNTEGEESDDGCSNDIEQPCDPSSAFTAKTPHKRRRSSSVSGGPINSDCCLPENPFELAPEQLAQHLCSSSIFEQTTHQTPESFDSSIEQLAELFPASFDEEELLGPHPGGINDPHEEQAQNYVDQFLSTQEMVPSPCKLSPIVIVLSPSTSSESSDDEDKHPLKIELEMSSDASEEILSVSRDVDHIPVSEDHSTSDGVRDENSAQRERASRGRVRRRLFGSGDGKETETAADDTLEFRPLSQPMDDALEGRSSTPPFMPLYSSPICKGDPMLPSWSHASDEED
ncbi:hypothetical protein HPB50_004927 [Hyalomma asiaticum]|uniref:Uncharacterized protein n=1 Tax=Hyalomma asiaticum TaxID=266040 RepID=A0ACB7TCU7_HYAAI|nr:hypothetical protein HPB50_004927 [Hyalomma asiaticum]